MSATRFGVLLITTIMLVFTSQDSASASTGGGKVVCNNYGICTVEVTVAGHGGGSTSGPVLAEFQQAGGGIYWATCPFGTGSGGYVWRAQPPPGMGPTPGELAQRALDSLTLTKPSTGRYPAGTLANGEGFTVVRMHTWYFTDPNDFRRLTARAAAGGVWAQVTVTPVALMFTPGDGNATVSCAGPGTAWNSSYGPWDASPSGCDYQYPHSSIHEPGLEVTATYGIRWQVSWVGSGNTTGTLPDQTTTSTSRFAVAEEEALVIK